MICISLLGLFIILKGADFRAKKTPQISPGKDRLEPPSASREQTITIGIPTTAELVQKLVQTSDSNALIGKSDDSGPPPPWLVEFESLAGKPPLDGNRAMRLWDHADAMPDGEQKSVFYAMVADQVDPITFQRLIWPKVWDPSTRPEVARIIANTVTKQPEEIMFPYLLALLQHRDEDTRAMARGVLWGYFPNIPESEYPQAVQLRNIRK